MSTSDPSGARQRLIELARWLSDRFIERDALVEAAMCALVAGQHVLIIGPPGTAKSQLAAKLCDAIAGATRFSWLLTRFTTPEELFGPVSLKGLEEDRYERLTAGKLPEAHVVFLDEVFKASSAILNTLLTLLNERKFHNGQRIQEAPLITLFGAANELPEEDELLALYDRFLVRVVVDYIDEDYRFLKLLTLTDDDEAPPALSLTDIEAARAAARQVKTPGDLLHDLVTLRTELKTREIVISDRRWRQGLDLMRARAWLEGRDTVETGDLQALRDVLWSQPDEREEVASVLDRLIGGAMTELRKLVFQAREVHTYPERFAGDEDARARAALEALTKLKQLARSAASLAEKASARGAGREAREAVDEIAALRDALAKTWLKEPL